MAQDHGAPFFDYPVPAAKEVRAQAADVLLPDVSESDWTVILEFAQARRFSPARAFLTPVARAGRSTWSWRGRSGFSPRAAGSAGHGERDCSRRAAWWARCHSSTASPARWASGRSPRLCWPRCRRAAWEPVRGSPGPGPSPPDGSGADLIRRLRRAEARARADSGMRRHDCASSGRGTCRWPGVPRADPRAPGQPVFRTYTQLPGVPSGPGVLSGPSACWPIWRSAIAMFVRPSGALFTFFKIIVPLLPILFFIAPGLWRNICPLAAANQAARVFGFSRAGTTPGWLQRRGYLVAIALFFGIAGARLVLFNVNGPATGILLAVTIVNAFIMGVAFKGKSGWCSSICPLLPLQRVYGQTPFLLVANTHCNPCVSCTKNCYDFKPEPAYQADLADPTRHGAARDGCSPPRCPDSCSGSSCC